MNGGSQLSYAPSSHPRTVRMASFAAPARPDGARSFVLAFAVLSVPFASAFASVAGCRIGQIAEFPITMDGLRPLMTAGINDAEVRFVVDSGAFYSMMSAASAAQLNLKLSPAPFGFSVKGVHGDAEVSIAKVKTFTLAGVPLHDVEFLVGGSEVGEGGIGVLGQNVLHIADVEYDLARGSVRLMKALDCSKAELAYWAGTSMPYSVVKLLPEPGLNASSTGSYLRQKVPNWSHALSVAYVNGTEIRVLYDTGAPTSVLSLKAAARAGVTPGSPGVVSAGVSWGFGKGTFPAYIARFSSFKIGDEEIRNTKLRIGDLELTNADMLVGADFFLSHRIYVANSQNKLYFTYNGGPVFNLTADSHPDTQASTAAQSDKPDTATSAPDDAAAFGRRGAALASRRNFDQALVSLTRACELAPENPEYLYQRAMVYWQMAQPTKAKADFDQSLQLKPDYLPALIARADLLLQSGDKVLAGADLDAADAAAPKQADERYQMGEAYRRADLLAPAVAQYTLWIDAHADDARVPYALNSRCWLRALEGTDLALALKDCNAAIKRADKSGAFYAKVAESRGLVLLRMGDYSKSIADFDESLKIDAKNAWSRYGRGIDKRHLQRVAEGEADIAEATAIRPKIAEEFRRRGIAP